MGLARPPFPVLAVGGTNGKGSTVALCEAVLRAAGHRTGAYTSPHLIRYNERVQVNGAPASDAQLCAAFERIEARRGAVPLTYFEYGTLAALDVFRDQAIDIALLEVGMGGRLDAVNAVDPEVAVVTSIGIDHTRWLGPDRASIAREKAGIFRPGRPAVCGDPDPPATLLEAAARTGASLYLYGRDFRAEPAGDGWTLRFGRRVRPGLPLPVLRGDYQLSNAACAIVALELLAERFPVMQEHVRRGLLSAVAPGRFQLLPGTPLVILDVAHNVQAAEALARNLARHRVAGRTRAVFGMLIDKTIASVAAAVAPEVDEWYPVSLPAPRGATAAQVAQALAEAGVRAPAALYPNAAAGFEAARAAAGPADRVVVFGSFYMVGDIMAYFSAGLA